MKGLIFFVIALFSLINNCFSQVPDSIKYKYNNFTIYRQGGYFLKGNERLTFQELRSEFSKSELGKISYDKAKSYRNTSLFFRIGSIVCGLASIAVIANNRNNRNTAYALLGGQFALIYGASKYIVLSNKSLDRALWQRNKDLLFPD